jgi:hypothetical protein
LKNTSYPIWCITILQADKPVSVDITFYHTGTLPPFTITGTRRTANSITVDIGTIPDGVDRVIIGYHRLDLEQPVVGQFVNNDRRSTKTFSSLLPGAKYRITTWGLGGSSNRLRSRSPAVVEVTTREQSEFA